MRAVLFLATATVSIVVFEVTKAGTLGGAEGANAARFACSPPERAALVMLDRHALRGDVDGDGRGDRVFTALVRHSTPYCRFALVVVSGGRYGAVTLHKDGMGREIGAAPWEAGTPEVDVLAPLDRQRGAEMLVAIWQGGSGRRFDAVFTMRERRFKRLNVAGASTAGNVLDFGSGGSAVVALGCDKDRRGRFYRVVGLHDSDGNWRIRRTYYAFRNDAVFRLFERREVHPDLTRDFDGLLAGCAVATNWPHR